MPPVSTPYFYFLKPMTVSTATPTAAAAVLHINRAPAPKRVINLAELAEVQAAAPAEVRRRTPLPVLSNHLYSLAFRKPSLIEEVEAVLEHETARRTAPTMAVAR